MDIVEVMKQESAYWLALAEEDFENGEFIVAKKVTIVSGNVPEQVCAWLIERGATIEDPTGLAVISLPEKADVNHDSYYAWRYTISFYGPDGNDEDSYVEVELDIDAYETRLNLRKA